MISWQIWHHVSGTHLTHRPASVRTAHICTQPDSCHSIRMQASQKSALAFQLTQDNAGGKRHSRANHLPERIRFDFRVTFLTGLSWSHQQCQLFMGVFQILTNLPTFIPLFSACGHTDVPQGRCASLGSQRQLCQLFPSHSWQSRQPRELDTEIARPHSLAVVTGAFSKQKGQLKSRRKECVLAGHNSRLGNPSLM